MKNSKQLVIIGAGGHGRVAADIARLREYESILFLDDAQIPEASGKVADYVRYRETAVFFVAIGNGRIRSRIQKELQVNGCEIMTLIHPNSVVGNNVRIGAGSIVMAGVVVNAGAVIGEGVILNTCCSVDHDCKIADYCHISVGAHLAGTVHVGEQTMIGTGATVINNLVICEECMIGAGAVVVKDIKKPGTYVGVPAKEIV